MILDDNYRRLLQVPEIGRKRREYFWNAGIQSPEMIMGLNAEQIANVLGNKDYNLALRLRENVQTYVQTEQETLRKVQGNDSQESTPVTIRGMEVMMGSPEESILMGFQEMDQRQINLPIRKIRRDNNAPLDVAELLYNIDNMPSEMHGKDTDAIYAAAIKMITNHLNDTPTRGGRPISPIAEEVWMGIVDKYKSMMSMYNHKK